MQKETFAASPNHQLKTVWQNAKCKKTDQIQKSYEIKMQNEKECRRPPATDNLLKNAKRPLRTFDRNVPKCKKILGLPQSTEKLWAGL